MTVPRTWIIAGVASLVTVALAHAVDTTLLDAMRTQDVYGDDWGRALRVLGYVPVWIVVGVVFVLIDLGRRDQLTPPVRDAYTRGVLLVLSALSSGALAEGLKLVFRRSRPPEPGTEFIMHALDPQPWWSTSGLGLPSSHAAVAAGACAMLALLHPRAKIVFGLAALGCGATRVMAGAHWPSDVAVGIWVGVFCALAWWTLHQRNLRRDGLSREASA
ncbi:MAG: hypothetical protein Tsb0013_15020 [Phycisphaerales bacterium]